ncbi:HNH endonuclease signature motif containing protein [Enterovirga sp. CN4-39]|uniref:HNH endonuclease signature motif containing protein n=1 Tax=Enterovirga sp. CN4-39 TaxID=3400910 RepID=UPI003C0C9C0E
MKLTPEIAQKMFRYNPVTGALTWRYATGRARPGDLVGGLTRGYLRVTVLGSVYLVHRICWMVQTGSEPPPIIDHANGNRGDNRWSNLRAATPSENAFNVAFRRARKKLPLGVIQHPSTKLYRAKITQDGSTWASPWFDTVDKAVSARAAKAVEMYGEFFRKSA